MQPTKIGKLHSAILWTDSLQNQDTSSDRRMQAASTTHSPIPHTNGLDNVMQLCFFVFLIEMLIGFLKALLSDKPGFNR